MGCSGISSTNVNEDSKEMFDKRKKYKKKIVKMVDNEENIITKENNVSSKGISFNKELCQALANKLPIRTKTNFQAFKDILKSNTNNLSQKEKCYVIFLWICENISYDTKLFFKGEKVGCTPEGLFKNGLTVCSGYARLYKDFSSYLDLEVECISCYAKGINYEPGQKLDKTNHEYNVIKLENEWYIIDSTWGAGYLEDKQFIKCYNEFYFLVNPK